MYVIESNSPYSRHQEFLQTLDPVTKRPVWNPARAEALEFATKRSALRFCDPALVERAATPARPPPTMAERFLSLYDRWDEHCTALYAQGRGAHRHPDLWEFVREHDDQVSAISLWDAVPRGEDVTGLHRLVDVIAFDDGSTALRRYDEGRAGNWTAA